MMPFDIDVQWKRIDGERVIDNIDLVLHDDKGNLVYDGQGAVMMPKMKEEKDCIVFDFEVKLVSPRLKAGA